MTDALLEVHALRKVWAPRAFSRQRGREAVAGVDLAVHPGDRVGLIGESGSGKTTLAKLISGLVRPTSGHILLSGRDTRTFTRGDWARQRRQLQFLFQDPRAMLNPAMPIGQLLHESARLHCPGTPAAVQVREVLAQVGLAGRESARPHQLSGGERRRAGIARILLARPRLILADEPTAGLDAPLKASILETLLENSAPESAIVLISHDLPMVAWACHRILVMYQGTIVDRFPTAALHHAERHPYTRQLLAASGLGSGA